MGLQVFYVVIYAALGYMMDTDREHPSPWGWKGILGGIGMYILTIAYCVIAAGFTERRSREEPYASLIRNDYDTDRLD
jgi:hypothetical protein